jgi:hypothetical protein
MILTTPILLDKQWMVQNNCKNTIKQTIKSPFTNIFETVNPYNALPKEDDNEPMKKQVEV